MGFVVNREPQRFKWAFMPWTSRLSMSVPASPPPPAGASADQFRRSGYTLLPGVISPESARCMATYALLQQNWPGYYQPEEMFGAALGRYADALSESLLSALHLPLASRHRRCGRCVWQVRAGTSPWRWRPATCSSTAAPTCLTGANLSRANTGYRPSCTMWTPTAHTRISSTTAASASAPSTSSPCNGIFGGRRALGSSTRQRPWVRMRPAPAAAGYVSAIAMVNMADNNGCRARWDYLSVSNSHRKCVSFPLTFLRSRRKLCDRLRSSAVALSFNITHSVRSSRK